MNPYNFIFDKLTYTSDSISINKFSLSVAGKNLFTDSPLTLSPGNIYGLIGKNGCGKTSLLKQLALNNIFEENKIRVLYVEQELEMKDKNAVEFIFESNVKLAKMSKDVENLEKQLEDVPHDMIPYQDANGNVYDFGFGLNWKGVIKDARTEKYSIKK
jgi:ATPase subunit of ABC transporter with duplicated ATPase domains